MFNYDALRVLLPGFTEEQTVMVGGKDTAGVTPTQT
jgi:hypothetical protein